MEKVGTTRDDSTYHYKVNNTKRAIADIEGLESNEEEVEDL